MNREIVERSTDPLSNETEAAATGLLRGLWLLEVADCGDVPLSGVLAFSPAVPV
jgi:hypothetical protein